MPVIQAEDNTLAAHPTELRLLIATKWLLLQFLTRLPFKEIFDGKGSQMNAHLCLFGSEKDLDVVLKCRIICGSTRLTEWVQALGYNKLLCDLHIRAALGDGWVHQGILPASSRC
jgi:hypothetical protein